MQNDPIVEEVRRIRDQYAKKHQYDLDLIFRDLKQKQAASKRNYVKLPPRAPVQEAKTDAS